MREKILPCQGRHQDVYTHILCQYSITRSKVGDCQTLYIYCVSVACVYSLLIRIHVMIHVTYPCDDLWQEVVCSKSLVVTTPLSPCMLTSIKSKLRNSPQEIHILVKFYPYIKVTLKNWITKWHPWYHFIPGNHKITIHGVQVAGFLLTLK